LTDQEVYKFHRGDPEALKSLKDKDAHELVEALPFDSQFEIARDKLLIGNIFLKLKTA